MEKKIDLLAWALSFILYAFCCLKYDETPGSSAAIL